MRTVNTGMIATLMVAGTALLTIGCGSSSDSTGGTGGRSGTGGAGGTLGGTGGSAPHLINYTFDTTVQMWGLNTFADTTANNLAAPNSDAGVAVDPPTAVFDSTVGSPSPGSLKVTVTFTNYGQYVDPVINLMPTVDLTGKTLHGKLQVTSVSGGGSFMGGAQLHISTGATYDGYYSTPFTIPATTGVFGDATPLALSATTAPVNPAAVIQIGVQIFTGTAAAAGTPLPGGPQTVVFNIDTITD